MTREEALKHIEELEKLRKGFYPTAPPTLELYQDLADCYGLSLEQLTEKMMILGGIGFTRPIRAKRYKKHKKEKQL
jgi:hypothetical protein